MKKTRFIFNWAGGLGVILALLLLTFTNSSFAVIDMGGGGFGGSDTTSTSACRMDDDGCNAFGNQSSRQTPVLEPPQQNNNQNSVTVRIQFASTAPVEGSLEVTVTPGAGCDLTDQSLLEQVGREIHDILITNVPDITKLTQPVTVTVGPQAADGTYAVDLTPPAGDTWDYEGKFTVSTTGEAQTVTFTQHRITGIPVTGVTGENIGDLLPLTQLPEVAQETLQGLTTIGDIGGTKDITITPQDDRTFKTKVEYELGTDTTTIIFTREGTGSAEEGLPLKEYYYEKITSVGEDGSKNKEVVSIVNNNVFHGTITTDPEGNIIKGSGTLILADGKEMAITEIVSAYILENGHLKFSAQNKLEREVVLKTADDKAFEFSSLIGIDNTNYIPEAVYQDVISALQVQQYGQLPAAILELALHDPKVAALVNIERIKQGGSITHPKDVFASAPEATNIGSNIAVGDFKFSFTFGQDKTVLEALKQAATDMAKLYYVYAQYTQSEEYLAKFQLYASLSEEFAKQIEAINAGKKTTVSSYEMIFSASMPGHPLLFMKANETYLWYEYQESNFKAATGELPFAHYSERKEYAIAVSGDQVLVQYGTNQKFLNIYNQGPRYHDWGNFDAIWYEKNGEVIKKMKVTGLEYRDEDNNGIFEKRVCANITTEFVKPVNDILKREVGKQVITGYSLDLTTGAYQAHLEEFASNGSILYRLDRNATTNYTEFMQERFQEGSDSSDYFYYDENGRLVKQEHIEGTYAFNEYKFKAAYQKAMEELLGKGLREEDAQAQAMWEALSSAYDLTVTVDGKPAKAEWFVYDSGTGTWKLYGQVESGASTMGSGGGAGGGGGGNGGSGNVQESSNIIPPATTRATVGNGINKGISDYRKALAKGLEEALKHLEEQGLLPKSISQKIRSKLAAFKNQRVARSYRLKQAVVNKIKDKIKAYKEGKISKEELTAYLKKLGFSEEKINEIMEADDKDIVKKAQALLLEEYGVSEDEINKFLAGELSLEELAKKYEIPAKGIERIISLDADEARSLMFDRAVDENGKEILSEDNPIFKEILDILEATEFSSEKYNLIAGILEEEFEFNEEEIKVLIGDDPDRIMMSELYRYNTKQAAKDYLVNEVGLPEFTAELIATGKAEGLDGLITQIQDKVSELLGGKITKEEWEAKKDKLIDRIMKALFSGELTPEADVGGIVKEIVDEIGFEFAKEDEKAVPADEIKDKINIGDNPPGREEDEEGNPPSPTQQAVRKQSVVSAQGAWKGPSLDDILRLLEERDSVIR
ncbi:MAG: hypothetical protein AB7E08_01630 [Candidatus Omnitrophota bacterium]